MNTTTIQISPVNIESRKKLGIKAGDTVRVTQRIVERDMKDKEKKEKVRLQAFEGLVLARKHGDEAGGTFTVRKIASGVGVEKIFPLYSPMIDKIEIIRTAQVRRSKLYYIRDKAAKEVKKHMKHSRKANNVVERVEEETPEVQVEEATENTEA
jgi:large subunit ribosomal protein L19